MRRVLLFPFLILGALGTMSCDLEGFASGERFKEDFRYSYKLQPGGRLSIENFNGSVEIVGWDQNQVEITGTKYANTEDLLKALKIDVVSAADSIRIRTIRPSDTNRGNLGAHYVIRVPVKTELERVASSNGAVRIDNIEGRGRITTSNGSVHVVKYRGDLDAKTSNGAIDVYDTTGPLILRTSNGSVKVDSVRGNVEATTTNGRIEARVRNTESQRPLRFETSNGAINVTLDSVKDSDVRAVTTNGGITVRLPANAGARVQARAGNSTITSDFEVGARGTVSKNHLEGTIGSGGPLLDLSTSNGNIKIQKL